MKVYFFGGNSGFDSTTKYISNTSTKNPRLWFPPFPFVRSTLLTCQDPQSKSHWQTRKKEETQYFAYKKERELGFFILFYRNMKETEQNGWSTTKRRKVIFF